MQNGMAFFFFWENEMIIKNSWLVKIKIYYTTQVKQKQLKIKIYCLSYIKSVRIFKIIEFNERPRFRNMRISNFE
jgi:hypothetical protein